MVFTRSHALNITSDPLFSNMKFIGEDFLIAFLQCSEVKLNKAYAIGFTILERSRQFMYSQFYKHIKPKFDEATVCMTDTDSFVLKVITDGKSPPLQKLNELIDYSNYPKDHAHYDVSRKNALGYFKDEHQSKTMNKFVALRAKCYIMEVDDEVNNKKLYKSAIKGVRKGYKKKFPIDSFLKCLKKKSEQYVTQYHIQSRDHVVNLTQVRKRAFSSFDDKTHILR